jgi:hypothetical protein
LNFPFYLVIVGWLTKHCRAILTGWLARIILFQLFVVRNVCCT